MDAFHPDHERMERHATQMEAMFESEGFLIDEVTERHLEHEAMLIALWQEGDKLAMKQRPSQPTG